MKFSKVRDKYLVIVLRIFVNGDAISGKRLLICNLDSDSGYWIALYFAAANRESSIATLPITSPIFSTNDFNVRGWIAEIDTDS